MRSKLILALSTALVLSGALVSVAAAEDISAANIRVRDNAGSEVRVEDKAVNTEVRIEDGIDATSTSDREEERDNETRTATQEDDRDNATSTKENDNGQLTAESHRNAVANFVQSLLKVADREGGVGAQVREVARAQQDSASNSSDAITKVQSRSALRTFFLGSDYRNLGQLRSEMAKTSANISKLQNLIADATSTSDKAELTAQLQVLENSQTKISAFVQTHENVFSLFGWFVRLFVK